MLFRSSHNYKTNGVTPIRVGPQGPSQLIFEDFTQNFDVVCSFVYILSRGLFGLIWVYWPILLLWKHLLRKAIAFMMKSFDHWVFLFYYKISIYVYLLYALECDCNCLWINIITCKSCRKAVEAVDRKEGYHVARMAEKT